MLSLARGEDRLLLQRNTPWKLNLCDPDATGRSRGFPMPNDRGGFDLTCTSGAVGKCIHWGYRPWEERPGGPPLQALHQACVHMARADYGGDGHGMTRDGTLIFFCDRFGIYACELGALMAFEAGWGTDSATCVARPRIPKTSRWSNWPSATLGSSRAWVLYVPKTVPGAIRRRCCSIARKNDRRASAISMFPTPWRHPIARPSRRASPLGGSCRAQPAPARWRRSGARISHWWHAAPPRDRRRDGGRG
jgi:hypothetical protein